MIIVAPDSGRTCCALCYNAASPRCTCICGGGNHGIGRLDAIANARVLADAGAGVTR